MAWSNHVDLKQKATQYGMIIVCPDGQDSWYFDSPIDPKMQFETYVSKELIEYMDIHYRTIAKADKRAITGMSMGGHGALWLAWRHPDVFKHCGSMSGGVDITKFPDSWNIDKRLGKYASSRGVWATHSVASLVPMLKAGQNIIIDCGDRDFFFEVNMALHQALEAKGIAHDFTIRAGQHSWQYWVESLDKHLKFFDQALSGKLVKCNTSIVTRDKAAKTPEVKKTETQKDAPKPEVKKPEKQQEPVPTVAPQPAEKDAA
jgi:S-formylglutathione hydrolase FrmB